MFACLGLGYQYIPAKMYLTVYLLVAITLLKIDSWVRKGNGTKLFKLEENVAFKTNGYKLPMNVFRLEMRRMSLTIRR